MRRKRLLIGWAHVRHMTSMRRKRILIGCASRTTIKLLLIICSIWVRWNAWFHIGIDCSEGIWMQYIYNQIYNFFAVLPTLQCPLLLIAMNFLWTYSNSVLLLFINIHEIIWCLFKRHDYMKRGQSALKLSYVYWWYLY